MRMNWELIGGLVALAGAVLLAILILEWVKRWVRQPAEPSKGEEIGHFRKLKDQGLLTEEEFARVQSAVEGRSRKPAVVEEPPKREEGIFDASARQAIRASPNDAATKDGSIPVADNQPTGQPTGENDNLLPS